MGRLQKGQRGTLFLGDEEPENVERDGSQEFRKSRSK